MASGAEARSHGQQTDGENLDGRQEGREARAGIVGRPGSVPSHLGGKPGEQIWQ
jgi:hypothetical protein